MVVLVLEKWGLHPELCEKPSPRDAEGSGRQSATPDLNGLATLRAWQGRDADVLIPADEYERAKEILFGESEIERAGF